MRVFVFSALAALLLIAPPAQAQTSCGDHDAAVAHLAERYGEAVVGRGLLPSGQMIEILAAQGGSFSVIVTDPGGRACMVASGQSYNVIAQEPGGVDG